MSWPRLHINIHYNVAEKKFTVVSDFREELRAYAVAEFLRANISSRKYTDVVKGEYQIWIELDLVKNKYYSWDDCGNKGVRNCILASFVSSA